MSSETPRTEDTLFGFAPAPARFNPGTRGPKVDWPPGDDLSLWPLFLACESRVALNLTAEWATARLGRAPKRSGQSHRTRKELIDGAHSIFMDRIQTRHIVGTAKWPNVAAVEALRDRLFVGLRESFPVTWAEHLIISHYRSNVKTQKRIHPPELVRYLERYTVPHGRLEDVPPVSERWTTADLSGPGNPTREANRDRLRSAWDLFRALADDPEVPIGAQEAAWGDLHAAARS